MIVMSNISRPAVVKQIHNRQSAKRQPVAMAEAGQPAWKHLRPIRSRTRVWASGREAHPDSALPRSHAPARIPGAVPVQIVGRFSLPASLGILVRLARKGLIQEQGESGRQTEQ